MSTTDILFSVNSFIKWSKTSLRESLSSSFVSYQLSAAFISAKRCDNEFVVKWYMISLWIIYRLAGIGLFLVTKAICFIKHRVPAKVNQTWRLPCCKTGLIFAEPINWHKLCLCKGGLRGSCPLIQETLSKYGSGCYCRPFSTFSLTAKPWKPGVCQNVALAETMKLQR